MTHPWFDRLGTLASATCALHCAVMALLPALLPLVGLGFLHDERFEWLFLACAVGFAGAAAWFGHRAHRTWAITLGFALGATALIGARLGEVFGIEGGLVFALLGGGLLVASHLFNLQRCRGCAEESCGA